PQLSAASGWTGRPCSLWRGSPVRWQVPERPNEPPQVLRVAGPVGTDQLDGAGAAQEDVLREMGLAHAPRPQTPLELVLAELSPTRTPPRSTTTATRSNSSPSSGSGSSSEKAGPLTGNDGPASPSVGRNSATPGARRNHRQ